MTNIEKALLSNVFPHVEISLLEEIIDATPSSAVCVEILCGIYLEPEMPVVVWKDKNKTVAYNKESFDKWRNQVSYSFMTPKSIGGGYYPNTLATEDINETNFKELKVDPSHTDCRYVNVYSLTEVEKNTNTMDLDRWLKLTPACLTELPVAKFEEQKKSIKITEETAV